MRRMFLMGGAAAVIAFFGVASLALATDQSSANYKNLDSTFAPAVFDASSANYKVTAAVEPIVGFTTSANFNLHHGVPVKDTINPTPPPPPPPPPGGGGGGGGGGGVSVAPPTSTTPTATGTAIAPTLVYRSPTFLSHQVIGGSHDASVTTVEVNGSANGVQLLPNLFWQRDLPLFVGYNEIRVIGKDASGLSSEAIGGSIERMLVGDASRKLGITTHHVVDDVDISLFTRAWKTYDFYSDFNEDGVIDDADLSLLASHWGLTADY